MKSTILTRAHEITRATIALFPSADYHVTFRAALRIAWSECRAELTPRAAWLAMDGDAQTSALIGMVWSRKSTLDGECNRRGEYRPNVYNWVTCADDAMDIAADAWLEMQYRLEANEYSDFPLPLPLVMANACDNAAQNIYRAERKHANACKHAKAEKYNNKYLTNYNETDENGHARILDIIDDNGGTTAERIAPSPYEYAALSESINAACVDSIDREIMRCKIYGLKQDEIAERLNVNQGTISRRMCAIRKRYFAEQKNA